jgi:hypothetical protein
VVKKFQRVEKNIRRTMDPFPGSTKSRMEYAEHKALKAIEAADPNTWVMRARLDLFSNTLLEATFRTLPPEVQEKWAGNLALDATFVSTWGKEGTREEKETKGGAVQPGWVGSDREGGWWARHPTTHAPAEGEAPRSGGGKYKYGYDAIFAVMTANAPGADKEFPYLAMGMSFGRPGEAPGILGRNALQSIVERANHPVGYLMVDRAYVPGAKVENFQGAAHAWGYKIVADYGKDDYGVKEEQHGALYIEGGIYCPALPQALRSATSAKRAVTQEGDHTPEEKAAARALYKEQNKQRKLFEVHAKETDSAAGGKVPMRCPAVGPTATVACPLKPQPTGFRPKRALRPILQHELPQIPPKLCQNKESTHFDPIVGLKYKQHFTFGTEEWKRWYGLRNYVEAFNRYVKRGNGENLGDESLRQFRGLGSQQYATAMLVAVANLRMVQDFLNERGTGAAQKPELVTVADGTPVANVVSIAQFLPSARDTDMQPESSERWRRPSNW